MATKDITDRQVVEAFLESKRAQMSGTEGWGWPEDILCKSTGQPVKVCVSAMRRAEERGLIECGVSLHSGWVTGKGKELLASSPDVLHEEARLGAQTALSGQQKQNATRTPPPA